MMNRASPGLLKMNLDELDAYDVRVETRAERALPAARDFEPDLILLDVAMPGLLGSEVLTQLRADAKVGRTPIVFLSATVGRQRVKDSKGVIDGHPFIAKPASVDEIIEGIERHLIPSAVAAVSAAAHSRVRWAEVVAPPEAPPLRVPIPTASPPAG